MVDFVYFDPAYDADSVEFINLIAREGGGGGREGPGGLGCGCAQD